MHHYAEMTESISFIHSKLANTAPSIDCNEEHCFEVLNPFGINTSNTHVIWTNVLFYPFLTWYS